MHQLINSYLANDEWIKLDIVLENIFTSPLRGDKDVLGNVFSQIVFDKKHWKLLEKGNPDHLRLFLCIVEAITFHGNEESVALCFSESHGILALKNLFKRCTELQKVICINILGQLLCRKDDLKFVQQILPVVVQSKDMVGGEKNISFKILQAGVTLIHNVSLIQGSEDLMLEIFKSGMVPYAIQVLSKCQKLKDDVPIERIIPIWNSVCETIAAVIKAKSDILNKCDVPILTEAALKIIRKCTIDLTEHKSLKIKALDRAVQVLGLFTDKLVTTSDLNTVVKYGIIKGLVPVMLLILRDDDYKRSHRGLIHNCYLLTSWMMFVEPDVRVIAPALLTILNSFNEDPFYYSSEASLISTVCYQAVLRGNKKEVKHLINRGLMPLLAKLRGHLEIVRELFELVSALYFVILKVPETEEFSHFEKRLYDTLIIKHWSVICCLNRNCGQEDLIENKRKKIELAYVIVALGISSMCTDEDRFKSLDD